MNNPDLYRECNNIHKRDSLRVLTEYSNKINWKKNGGAAIDIGSGDGSVTYQVVGNCIPRNYNKLVGCDISEKMVKHAKKHHGDERTSFTLLDIAGDLPREFYGSFDQAFSFYALNWVLNQDKAFKNIYSLLAAGGDCVLAIITYQPMFDIYRILSRSDKWRTYLRYPDRFISPYHDSQEPEKDLQETMEINGFKNINVVHRHNTFVFKTVAAFKDLTEAVNAFEIPETEFEDYLHDFVNLIRNGEVKNLRFNHDEEPNSIVFNYGSIVAYGSK